MNAVTYKLNVPHRRSCQIELSLTELSNARQGSNDDYYYSITIGRKHCHDILVCDAETLENIERQQN